MWDDLIVDSSASIRTAVTGSAPNRRFIVEWRNVRFYADSSLRVSFEVIFEENGPITLAYTGIGTASLERGSDATVGIENAAGTVAFEYSRNLANLRDGEGVTFTAPG
jgi:hypothetical protein